MVCKEVDMGSRLPAAIVMNLSRNGLGVIRSLGRRGIPVIGVDTHLNGPGAKSRYCEAIACPDPNTDEQALLAFLMDLGRKFDRRATVFPTSDDFVRFLSRHRHQLKHEYSLALPSQDTVCSTVNKRKTYEEAVRLHVPVPKTLFPQDDTELELVARAVSYPVLIKATMSHTGSPPFPGKALRVESEEQLLDRYHQLAGAWSSIMVQELIPGGDDQLWTLGAYLDRASRPLAVFSGRKLRQYPPHFGTCSLGQCEWNLDVVKLGLHLLKGIGYVGPTQVEFKYDARDDTYKLMEINARTWLWHTLASDRDVDLAYIAYLDQSGQVAPRRVLGKQRARWLSIIADTASAKHYMARNELSWFDWIGSWRGVRQFDLLSLSDPLPFIATTWRVIRHKIKVIE
jgi:D-aspartate ligase